MNLIALLKENEITIGIETQGSRWQDWFYDIDELTISPKPPSSKMVTDFDILDQIILILKIIKTEQHVSLKVVIFNDEDYEFAKKIHQRYPDVPFFFQVGNDDITTMDNAPAH